MLIVLYSKSSGPTLDLEDKNFDKLNGLLEGMKKIFSIQVETLSEIEFKVNQLSKRKDQREKLGPSFLINMQKYEIQKELEARLKLDKE